MYRVVDPQSRARNDDRGDAQRDSRSDEGLLDAYLRGERAAFPRLMHRYSNELLHFLTRFLGPRAAADDVFQETFLQIHLSAETFDPERRFAMAVHDCGQQGTRLPPQAQPRQPGFSPLQSTVPVKVSASSTSCRPTSPIPICPCWMPTAGW